MLDFLLPLLEPKPSADYKLSAAWDGLTIESQIALLSAFPSDRSISLSVVKRALGSPNAYVRYLVARLVRGRLADSEEGREIRQQIEKDADPLVQVSLSMVQATY